MENIIIAPTNTTPAIEINYEEGGFTMTGASSPSNALQFYESVISAVSKLNGNAQQDL